MASNYTPYYFYNPYIQQRSRSINDISEMVYRNNQIQQPMFVQPMHQAMMIAPMVPVQIGQVPAQVPYGYTTAVPQNVVFAGTQRSYPNSKSPIPATNQVGIPGQIANTSNGPLSSGFNGNHTKTLNVVGTTVNGPARYRGRHHRSVSSPVISDVAVSRDISTQNLRTYAPSTSSSRESSIDSDSLQNHLGSSATSMHSANSSTQEEDYHSYKRRYENESKMEPKMDLKTEFVKSKTDARQSKTLERKLKAVELSPKSKPTVDEPARPAVVPSGAQVITPQQHAARLQNAKRTLAPKEGNTIRTVSGNSGLILPSDMRPKESHSTTDAIDMDAEKAKDALPSRVAVSPKSVSSQFVSATPETEAQKVDHFGPYDQPKKTTSLPHNQQHNSDMFEGSHLTLWEPSYAVSKPQVDLRTGPPIIKPAASSVPPASPAPPVSPQPAAISRISSGELRSPDSPSPTEAFQNTAPTKGNRTSSFQVLPKEEETPEKKAKKGFGFTLKNVFGKGNKSKQSPIDSDQRSIKSTQSAKSTMSSLSIRSSVSIKSFFGRRKQRADSAPAIITQPARPDRAYQGEVVRHSQRAARNASHFEQSPSIGSMKSSTINEVRQKTNQYRPPSPALKSESFDTPTPVSTNSEPVSIIADDRNPPPTNLSAGDISPMALTDGDVETLVCTLPRTNSITSHHEPSPRRRSLEDHVPNPTEIEAPVPLKREDSKKLHSAMKTLNKHPQRLRGAAKAPAVSFASQILIYRTFSSEEYDRKPDWMTSDIIREPGVAQLLREELNDIKARMNVHPLSKQNTQFFHAKPVIYK